MKLTIVGGGSAGWITALYLEQFFEQAEVTVIESSSLGILGAGEGTTPHFVGLFLDAVGISVADVVKHAGAVIKNGIRFSNWTGDGSAYFHPFDDLAARTLGLDTLHPAHQGNEHDLLFADAASLAARVLAAGPRPDSGDDDPFRRLDHQANMAVHFDAVRLARYLKRVAVGRGVRLLDGLVDRFDQDPAGNITRLHLRDGRSVEADLVFDCTGFHRLILGKLFQVPWKDLKHVLPVDRAIPFTLPLGEGPVRPETEARAMDHGWMWKIPVEDRYGCGYVFDSAFTDNQGALNELKRKFGPNVDATRVLNFTSGYYDRIWVNNCFGVGLATGFLEPLEATSIWISILTLREFVRVYLPLNDGRARAEFHDFYRTLMQRTVDFLYLHYLTPRTDTPFWATFRERTQMPDGVAAALADGGLRWSFESTHRTGGHPEPFPPLSWVYIARGLNLMHRGALDEYWKYYGLHETWSERRAERVGHIEAAVERCLAHDEFLAQMRAQAGARTTTEG